MDRVMKLIGEQVFF